MITAGWGGLKTWWVQKFGPGRFGPEKLRSLWPLCLSCLLLLGGCGGLGNPPQGIVEQALTLQFDQTQRQLGLQLFGRAQVQRPFDLNHVEVDQRQSVTLADRNAYRVTGTYDWQGKQASGRVQGRRAPFELYLQQSGKTWLLLRPGSGEGLWLEYPVAAKPTPPSSPESAESDRAEAVGDLADSASPQENSAEDSAETPEETAEIPEETQS